MLFMAINPDVQEKVRLELDQTIGKRKAKMTDKSSTPYTEAVLHEIQRKANILPISVFHSSSWTDPIKIGPYEVPPKTTIIPLIGEVMSDPESFPDPEKFDPERFLVKTNGTWKFQAHPKVIPFGVGRRKCLGEALARMSLYKFFTAIIQKYEIVSGQDEPLTEEGLSGFSRSPCPQSLMFKVR